MKRLLVVLLLAFALAACGHQGPTQGVVTDHKFIPAHDEFHPGIYIPGHESCYPVGKSESCSYFPAVFVPPYTSHVGDAWRLYLVNGKRKGWRTVNHATYIACGLGTDCNTKVKR